MIVVFPMTSVFRINMCYFNCIVIDKELTCIRCVFIASTATEYRIKKNTDLSCKRIRKLSERNGIDDILIIVIISYCISFSDSEVVNEKEGIQNCYLYDSHEIRTR